MFLRRVRPNISETSALCAGGSSCPEILETETGDFAIIGRDITEAAKGKLLPGTGCGPDEKVVLIPRSVLTQAVPHI
jgi:hypothetical protein